MQTSTPTLLATVSEVNGTEILGVLEDSFASGSPSIIVEGKRILVGQPASFALIRQDDIRILAQVKRIGDRESLGSAGDRARRYISLHPLGELDDKDQFVKGVERFPTVGAEVHAVLEDEVQSIFKRCQESGIHLGYLPLFPSTEACVNPTTLFSRHFAILGQSGSGKSWAVASLIQRVTKAMPRAHIVLLDPHGEYCWTDLDGSRRSAFDPDKVHYVDAQALEIPYWLLTFSELVDLMVDRSDSNATTQIAFLRETVQELRSQANRDLGLPHISVDTPVYFSLHQLYVYFKEANSKLYDFGKKKGPLYGQFDEFLIRLQSRMNDVRYGFLLKPQKRKDSASLTHLLRDFIGLGAAKRPITVIDLSSVPFDIRPTVSAQIGRLAFEFNYWNPRYREFPIALICEEAHAYIPRESRTQYEGTRKSMERIAKEGRKYGVSLGVVSQRPHELSETVLSQCGTYLCFRISNPDDQDYVRNLVPEAEVNLIDTLASLGRGEVMALGEAVPLPIRFQFYQPDPIPNSSDVEFSTHWTSGPEDIDVSDIVDRWRRQKKNTV